MDNTHIHARNPALALPHSRFARGVLTWLCALAVLLGASGCALQAASSGPTILRIAYRPDVADLQLLLDAYMRDHPGLVIESFKITATNGPTLNTEIQEGRIDLLRDYRSEIFFRLQNGEIEPLEGWTESGDWGKLRDDYYAGTWEGLNFGERQYGIPAGLDMYVAYANLDVFDAAFVPPPAEDWTLDDLLATAALVNAQEGTPGEAGVIYGFGTDYMTADPLIFTYLHGGRLVDDFINTETVYLNDTATVEAVTFYTDLFTRYQVAPVGRRTYEVFGSGGIGTAQDQGFCALWFGLFSQRGGGTSVYGTAVEWPFAWLMLPLPKDVTQVSLGDVDGYFIPANSAQQAQAMELVRWLADQWQASGTRFPVRRSLAQDGRYQGKVGEETARIGSLAADNLVIVPQFYGRYGGFLLSDFYNAIFHIIVEGEDVRTMLDGAQERVTAQLLEWQSEEQ